MRIFRFFKRKKTTVLSPRKIVSIFRKRKQVSSFTKIGPYESVIDLGLRLKKLIAFRVGTAGVQGSEVPKYGYAAGVYTSRLHFCQRIQIENIFVVSRLDLEPQVKAKV